MSVVGVLGGEESEGLRKMLIPTWVQTDSWTGDTLGWGGPPIFPVFSLCRRRCPSLWSCGLVSCIFSFIFLRPTPPQALPFSLGLYIPHLLGL